MTGRVVSVKSKNTATILVERLAKHPLYKKTYKQSKKYLADDPIGVKIGDIVDFINCKPISKRKSFRITKVLGKNYAEIAKEELKEKAEEAISKVMPEEPEQTEDQPVSQSAESADWQKAEKPKKKSTQKKETE